MAKVECPHNFLDVPQALPTQQAQCQVLYRTRRPAPFALPTPGLWMPPPSVLVQESNLAATGCHLGFLLLLCHSHQKQSTGQFYLTILSWTCPVLFIIGSHHLSPGLCNTPPPSVVATHCLLLVWSLHYSHSGLANVHFTPLIKTLQLPYILRMMTYILRLVHKALHLSSPFLLSASILATPSIVSHAKLHVAGKGGRVFTGLLVIEHNMLSG